MSIDANQSLDTLVGLQNKLVLILESGQDCLVLLPEGNVSWNKDGDHVVVQISWQADSWIHPYLIDRQLGQLANNSSLQSKLHLCYLHALTSFCLSDPLIQKTGTKQALSILHSAVVRLFDQLQPENCTVLAKIAELIPERHYYSENEHVMQSVYWCHDLEYLAQHGGFYLEVMEILNQDHWMGIFHSDTLVTHPPLPHIEMDLLKHEQIWSSAFRVSEFRTEDHMFEHNQHYSSLVWDHNSPACSHAYTISRMVYNEIPSVNSNSVEGLVSCL